MCCRRGICHCGRGGDICVAVVVIVVVTIVVVVVAVISALL